MNQYLLISFVLLFTVVSGFAQKDTAYKNGSKSLKFIKKQIASESFELAEAFDVNNDKIQDIVSGAFWYEGPGYVKRHYIGPGNSTANIGMIFLLYPLILMVMADSILLPADGLEKYSCGRKTRVMIMSGPNM